MQCLSYSDPNWATYCNLVYLELGFDLSNGPVLLPDLLQNSPKLEALVFPESNSDLLDLLKHVYLAPTLCLDRPFFEPN
ncbi:hypothetical protein RHMOL_Rhmol06G0293200 [Rhododendron molle]|uniref:Uncharacterized protein n=1 Tax=Rhododendron molle TaxID=49168 RepID=A0ACC0NHD5_RHOML|nr:hypothetical protein RHMOL_Rhmol06G0293200 [Rhododendron molle]